MHVLDRNLSYRCGTSDRNGILTMRMRLTSQLEISLFINQQVLRLQVSVKNTVSVAVVKTLDELIGEFLA